MSPFAQTSSVLLRWSAPARVATEYVMVMITYCLLVDLYQMVADGMSMFCFAPM